MWETYDEFQQTHTGIMINVPSYPMTSNVRIDSNV